MKKGTTTVAGFAEALVSGEIDVPGYGTVTVWPRQGPHLGTIVSTSAAAYTQNPSIWVTPVVLPVDFVP